MSENQQVKKLHTAAVILSAGVGKRMNADVPKQYIELEGKPLLYYTIKAFEDSRVDDLVIVTGAGDEEFCQKEIVEKFHFNKVRAIVPGGKERYHSVHHGLAALEESQPDHVFIHDGARPFVSREVLENAFAEMVKYKACIVGVPVKDTIKLVDEEGFVAETPRRDRMVQVQTPQIFEYPLIWKAYCLLLAKEEELIGQGIKITDDAMVVETLLHQKVKIITGAYENIKITTPEDLLYAQRLVGK